MNHNYKISHLINTLLDVIVDHGDIPLKQVKLELEVHEDENGEKYGTITEKRNYSS